MHDVVAYPLGSGQWALLCPECGPLGVALDSTVDAALLDHHTYA